MILVPFRNIGNKASRPRVRIIIMLQSSIGLVTTHVTFFASNAHGLLFIWYSPLIVACQIKRIPILTVNKINWGTCPVGKPKGDFQRAGIPLTMAITVPSNVKTVKAFIFAYIINVLLKMITFQRGYWRLASAIQERCQLSDRPPRQYKRSKSVEHFDRADTPEMILFLSKKSDLSNLLSHQARSRSLICTQIWNSMDLRSPFRFLCFQNNWTRYSSLLLRVYYEQRSTVHI